MKTLEAIGLRLRPAGTRCLLALPGLGREAGCDCGPDHRLKSPSHGFKRRAAARKSTVFRSAASAGTGRPGRGGPITVAWKVHPDGMAVKMQVGGRL